MVESMLQFLGASDNIITFIQINITVPGNLQEQSIKWKNWSQTLLTSNFRHVTDIMMSKWTDHVASGRCFWWCNSQTMAQNANHIRQSWAMPQQHSAEIAHRMMMKPNCKHASKFAHWFMKRRFYTNHACRTKITYKACYKHAVWVSWNFTTGNHTVLWISALARSFLHSW